ncbi:uncharacterized protein TNIN_363141 [Trichonephila inaurata madagascariensis]|uniref:Uncharacterized protein n=1 Tax=Trichonephila inaurata madagascariensis TaxID=2747483 RepID=A0A8X6MCH9_9ARAC|nr:uncharacterized protein TNIN_363141 [Trichonephila inaurata madagascariensis]
MAFSDRHPVLSLRQMSMAKLAIAVCRDPEILDFVKDYGCVSFVFPSKEAHLYLGVKSLKEEAWIWKDILIQSFFSSLYRHLDFEDHVPSVGLGEKNFLPFSRWEELVEERISSLPLLLKHELLDVVRAFSIEIDKWIKYHSQVWEKFSEIALSAPYDFQWNSLGKIDLVGTASALIVNETLDIKDRYILACLYGLMDKMPIGKKVPDEIVQKYSKLAERGIKVQKEWNPSHKGIQFNYFMRQNLFTSVSSEQKVSFLNGALSEECLRCDDFLFYMSHMGNEERIEVFKIRAFKILLLHLDWPLQGEFLRTAEHLLPYFTEIEFFVMLDIIICERIILHRKDFNYIGLLKEFWSLSPSNLKEYIKNYPIYELIKLIINFPVDEIFPSEKLLPSYESSNLTFRCCGVKYILCRAEKSRHIKARAPEIENDLPRSFLATFIFSKYLKRDNLRNS